MTEGETVKEVGKGSRRRGTLALILGTIGSLLSIAALVLSILFTVGANNAVDGVEERIIQPIDRLTEQIDCLLYTSPSPRDRTRSRMPSSA